MADMANSVALAPCFGNEQQLEGMVDNSSFRRCSLAAGSTGLAQESDDCFSRFGRQVSGHSAVRVKNTFIQAFFIDEDSDEDDELPMVAVKSCPLVRTCSMSTTYTSAGEISSDDSPAHRCPVARPRATEPQVVAKTGAYWIAPLELRKPEVSAGSSLHESGECKPCAWFWRPQGCENGNACRHCHMCPAGEVKGRKKARAVAARKSCRRSRASIAPPSAQV